MKPGDLITEEEIAMCQACHTPQEWNTACDTIKASRGGNYPPNWWDEMKLSGRMEQIFARWDDDPSLKIGIVGRKKGKNSD